MNKLTRCEHCDKLMAKEHTPVQCPEQDEEYTIDEGARDLDYLPGEFRVAYKRSNLSKSDEVTVHVAEYDGEESRAPKLDPVIRYNTVCGYKDVENAKIRGHNKRWEVCSFEELKEKTPDDVKLVSCLRCKRIFESHRERQ